MKVLVVKITSLGDIIHTLPAITDLKQHFPDAVIDWIVEESFANIISWHQGVNRIIPVATRRWRKEPLKAPKEFVQFVKAVRKEAYDIVIDPQGLFKSASISLLAKTKKRLGYDKSSIKEPHAAMLYSDKIVVDKKLHAVIKIRQLFAKAFHYSILDNQHNLLPTDYGLNDYFSKQNLPSQWQGNYVVFLHATTWSTKHWPIEYWQELGQKLNQQGYKIYLPWGTSKEKSNAENIAAYLENAVVLPKMSLDDIAVILFNACFIIAVDTGLGHLSAALAKPCISLYGATDAKKTGTEGQHQIHLSASFHCSPCLKKQCQYKTQREENYSHTDKDKSKQKSVFPPCYQTIDANTVYNQVLKLIA